MTRAAVAVVTTFYRPVLGGAEVAAERLARYLARRGHRVIVITKRTAREQAERESADGVEIERVDPIGERTGRGKWAVSPAVFRALLRHRHDVDVVCCVDYRAIGLAALAARSLTGKPVVFQAQTEGVISGARIRGWLHGLGVRGNGALADTLTWPLRALYGRADALGCISHALEREAIDAGVPRDRVHYLPNPVDCARFAPLSADARRHARADAGIAADDVVAVFVGRLSREKGVMELLRAWRQARPAARLVVIGPPMTGHGWDASLEARVFIEREGLADRVSLLGGQPTDAVARWLGLADFAVQPSHFEAMGLSAAEAMAAALPVIATDTSGYRDFVIPEETGLVVPVKDVDALARAIVRLAADRPARERMGANARRRAEAFDEPVVLERFAELIDRLAGAVRPV